MTEKYVPKRKHPRAPIQAQTIWYTSEGSVPLLTKDIGEGGIAFLCKEVLSVGERVKLGVDLTRAGMSFVTVEVVGVTANVFSLPGGGVLSLISCRFLDCSEKLRQQISDHIQSITKLMQQLFVQLSTTPLNKSQINDLLKQAGLPPTDDYNQLKVAVVDTLRMVKNE